MRIDKLYKPHRCAYSTVFLRQLCGTREIRFLHKAKYENEKQATLNYTHVARCDYAKREDGKNDPGLAEIERRNCGRGEKGDWHEDEWKEVRG